MGRELMRVPMDFAWPLNEVWEGYLNPYGENCPSCKGSGQTPGMSYLERIVDLLLLAAEDSMRGRIHPYLTDIFNRVGKAPTKDLFELVNKLSGKEPCITFGYGANIRWDIVRKIIDISGVEKSWGCCPTCEGEGIHPDFFEQFNSWDPHPPPKGKGYQLWETTSEGSPISPVFKTLDELCEWAEENATTFAHHKTTKEKWKEMLSQGQVYPREGDNIFF